MTNKNTNDAETITPACDCCGAIDNLIENANGVICTECEVSHSNFWIEL